MHITSSITYHDLTLQIAKSIPSGYKRIDTVADCYLQQSIKDPERKRRGMSARVIITPCNSRPPRDFNSFLDNSHNKKRLIEIISNTFIEYKVEVIDILKCQKVYFSIEIENTFLSNFIEFRDKIYLDCNRPGNQKLFKLSDVDVTKEENNVLIGFHAFSGNENHKFVKTFESMGETWSPTGELIDELEEFTCVLFGSRRIKDIND